MQLSNVPPPAWSLAGVVVGYCLGEGTRWMRERLRVRRLKKVLRAELSSVRAQIKDKEDILLQAIQALNTQEVLPMISVHTIRTGYDVHFNELYERYSDHERNCLHVIYERVRIADEMMDSFHEDFQKALKDGYVKQPWDFARGQLENLLESYKVVDKLTESFLKGKLVDVFHTEVRS